MGYQSGQVREYRVVGKRNWGGRRAEIRPVVCGRWRGEQLRGMNEVAIAVLVPRPIYFCMITGLTTEGEAGR